MSSFSFLLLCIQACLIQTVFSQALYGIPSYGTLSYGTPSYSQYNYNSVYTDIDVDVDINSYASYNNYGYAVPYSYGAYSYATPYSTIGNYAYGLELDAGLAYGNGLGSAGYLVSPAIAYGGSYGYGYDLELDVGLNLGAYSPGVVGGLGYGNSGLVGSSFEGYGFVPDVSVSASVPVTGPYVASGFGELAAGGDVAAYGTAVITGQLPALGVVAFNGLIPASGSVSIAGNCACAGIPL